MQYCYQLTPSLTIKEPINNQWLMKILISIIKRNNKIHSFTVSFKNGILLAYDKKTNRSLSYDEFKNRLESEYLVTSKSDLEIKQI